MLNKFSGRFAVQAAVRSDFIVFLSPRFNDLLGFLQGPEPMLVQAFISELFVEAFTKGVLNRLARINEMQLHAMPVRPFI